jgi:glycerol-3-phosphate dehydrogenase
MSDLAETADVIVVGGGSAGAVLERVYQRVYAAATRRLP